jgi:hypothetical protein
LGSIFTLRCIPDLALPAVKAVDGSVQQRVMADIQQ